MEITSKKSGSYRRKVMKEYKKIIEMKTEGAVQIFENNTTHDGGISLETNKEKSTTNIAEGYEGSVPVLILLSNNSEEFDERVPMETYHEESTAGDRISASDFFSTSTCEEDSYGRFVLNEDDDICEYTNKEENIFEITDYEKKLNLKKDIRKWAIQHNITQSALRDLAKAVNSMTPNTLPVDPRTLMKTPREITTTAVDPGEYWHNGLIRQISIILENLNDNQEIMQKISLIINIDGLPICNSSKNQFWPILCRIYEKPEILPIIIGIYAGIYKPNNLNAYLMPFVEEMKELLEKGIEINNSRVAIYLRCFVCDSPARAMIKGVQNFNGKHGCLKCTIVGEYSHVSHTVIFPGVNYPPRNDEDFRNRKYGEHHKMDSPILRLPIDMVESFPVADSLHLIDLGVMKRLLIGWRDGNLGKKDTKWRASDIHSVNVFLSSCKTPTEIHRSVRGLDNLAHWKGSEFRTFLLYLSVVILKDVLSQAAMTHYLSFFCAVTICSNEEYFRYLQVAKELFVYFVNNFKVFYGKDYITSNIHNLTHVVDEVQRFGKLQHFSAYPFENRLYMIKNMLRQGNRPLSQIAKRLGECAEVDVGDITKQKKTVYPFVKENKKDHKLVLHFKDFVLSPKVEDSYFLTNNGDIMETRYIEVQENKIYIKCYKVNGKMNVFERPINSSYLNIFKCVFHSNTKTECLCSPKDVKCKLVLVSHKSELYFLPLLHTF